MDTSVELPELRYAWSSLRAQATTMVRPVTEAGSQRIATQLRLKRLRA